MSLKFDKDKIRKQIFSKIKIIEPYKKQIMFYILILNTLMYFGFFFSYKSSLFLIVLSFISSVSLWIFTKDFLDEDEQNKFFKRLRLNVFLNFFMIVNYFLSLSFKIIQNSFSKNNITNTLGIGLSGNSRLVFALLINFIIYFFFIFLVRLEDFVNWQEKIKEINFHEKYRLNLEVEMTNGDIYICADSKKNVPVRLPYTDRFLHMLIIGPTGCGKTSQIITPMLNQDIKNLEAGVTVIEPKGDLAEKIYAMAQFYGREAIYFNPQLEACPSFNPLYGKEEDVIENIVTTFKMLDPDAKQYFQDMNEQLLRNALKILKRFKGNNATLLDLNTLITNPAGEGRLIVNKFIKMPAKSEAEQKENLDCATYFLENYFNEKSKTYENCSGIRSQVAKITSNKFLRKVLNPVGGKSDLNFEKHLEEGGVLCITTAQGKLRDLGSFLGYFIILNFQSAVFKRPGNEDNRRPHFLYIDEFQKYSNPGFADMLTQGRSYRVASHLATQARAQIGMGSGKDGNAFINLVSTNCRNVVVFPGVSYDDAKFYSDQFGQDLIKKERVSQSGKIFNPARGFQPLGYDSQSKSTEEKLEARFTPTDIIYQKKQHMMFGYVKNMIVQVPVSGKIDYIPIKLNKRLNQMIVENELLMKEGENPNLCRNLNIEGAPLIDKWEAKMPMIKQKFEELEEAERNYDDDNDIPVSKSSIEDELKGIDDVLKLVHVVEDPTNHQSNRSNSERSSGVEISEAELGTSNNTPVRIIMPSDDEVDDV